MLRIYNTLSRKKEIFKPLEGKHVKMYVCGPTTYDHSHVGHMRTFTFFDTVRRYLEYKGYNVTMAINITDIDDKIIRRANEEGVDFEEIADRYMYDFLDAMEAFNIRRPNILPKATAHIPDMFVFIEKLLKEGYAYIAEDAIYYDISKFEEYGKLSRQNRRYLLTGVRIEPSPHKRNAGDFALWKFKKPGEPSWWSPWGEGRPGWHLECSTMIWRHLGEQIDIHGGGADLIFPHHENEIAQSEAFTGKKPFVRYWVHVGTLRMKGEKMSKSIGNIVTWRDAIEMAPGAAWRLYYAMTQYRQPMNLDPDAVKQALEAVKRVYRAYQLLDEASGNRSIEASRYIKMFEERMDDDFDTPGAVAAMMKLVGEIEEHGESISEVNAKEVRTTLGKMMYILGIPEPLINEELRELVKTVVEIRSKLRAEKRYKESDKLRAALGRIGIELHDKKEGTKWYVLPK